MATAVRVRAGFRRLPLGWPLFLLGAGSGIIIGVAGTCWRHWLPPARAAYAGATLAAFGLSVTTGLAGFHETIGGVPQQLAGAAEAVALVAGVLAAAGVARQRRVSRARPGPQR